MVLKGRGDKKPVFSRANLRAGFYFLKSRGVLFLKSISNLWPRGLGKGEANWTVSVDDSSRQILLPIRAVASRETTNCTYKSVIFSKYTLNNI